MISKKFGTGETSLKDDQPGEIVASSKSSMKASACEFVRTRVPVYAQTPVVGTPGEPPLDELPLDEPLPLLEEPPLDELLPLLDEPLPLDEPPLDEVLPEEPLPLEEPLLDELPLDEPLPPLEGPLPLEEPPPLATTPKPASAAAGLK